MTSNTINVYANQIGMAGVSPLVTILARTDRVTRHRPADAAESRIASDQRLGMCSGNRQIAANSSASRLAPPTSAPSTSGWAMIAATFADLTEPP